MYAMYQPCMNTSADAWCAPVCQSARTSMAHTAILDTAVQAVSVLILGLVRLLAVLVRIIIPQRQS